jgi:DNA-binding beta-propeller fold protein YncE
MKILSTVAFASILLLRPVEAQNVISFESETARDASNLKSLNFKSRITVPYGPDLVAGQTSDQKPWKGYGFGVGAGENIAYDANNHYLYVSNQQGYATVVDYIDPENPRVTEYTLDFRGISVVGEGNDLAVCPEQGWIFLAVKNEGYVMQIAAVQRASPKQPSIIQKIQVDDFPRQLLTKSDCSMLVVANENDDELTTGSVTLVRKLDTLSPEVTIIRLDAEGGWDDSYPLSKGLHMPLTKNSLEYWDDYSHLADQLDFSAVRANYRSSIFIESETLAWGNVEETELIMNLQINNGILRVDVVNDKPLSLAGYGLKDHGEIPVDINAKDKRCNGVTYAHLFSMGNPDTVRVVRYNGKRYLLTANEGDNKEYMGFSDQIAAADVFQVSFSLVCR